MHAQTQTTRWILPVPHPCKQILALAQLECGPPIFIGSVACETRARGTLKTEPKYPNVCDFIWTDASGLWSHWPLPQGHAAPEPLSSGQ